MKCRPIIFSAPMVRAILEGRKTQTRRVMKPQPEQCPPDYPRSGHWWPSREHQTMLHIEDEMQNVQGGWDGLAASACPYGQPGDRLWVREAWRTYASIDDIPPRGIAPCAGVQYEAGGSSIIGTARLHGMGKLRPGMFMPRWACRILLEITAVRVERLHDISDHDALAEGADQIGDCDGACVAGFRRRLEYIHGPESWDANPWVWVIEFKRVEGGTV